MKNKYYADNKKIIELYKTKCALCGESHKCCLEFHHAGVKHFNISKSLKYITSLLLINELLLTVCLCKNCHSKIHNNILSLNN